MKKTLLFCAALALFSSHTAFGQRKEALSGYEFKTLADLKTTSVKDQGGVGSCWSFSTISFLESELLRKGKGTFDLSELFIVKNAYLEKGIRYVQFHGKNAFREGGQAHDVIAMIKKYGIVPEEVYRGLNYGGDVHNHGELVDALQGIVEGVNKNGNGHLTPVWTKALNAYIETYLGETPDKFTYQGKEYTPKTFTESLGLNLNDYVEITSFQAYPYYETVSLPLTDNWLHDSYYNVPLDELMDIMRHSLKKGYTICWDGDVSQTGFNFSDGIAILPSKEGEEVVNPEKYNWSALTAKEQKEKKNSYVEPIPERKVTEEWRQERFDRRSTNDDHLMHITGLLQDQYGTYYYKTKNSWAADGNKHGGYLNMSDAYCRMQTVAIMVHKDAIPTEICKKLGL